MMAVLCLVTSRAALLCALASSLMNRRPSIVLPARAVQRSTGESRIHASPTLHGQGEWKLGTWVAQG